MKMNLINMLVIIGMRLFFEHIYHGVPDEFLSLMESDEYEEVTFCMWFDDGWHENIVVDNDGGKSYLLSYICSDAVKWCKWACDYYERDFNVADVAKIYHGELSADLIKAVNPDCQVDEVIEEINLNRC